MTQSAPLLLKINAGYLTHPEAAYLLKVLRRIILAKLTPAEAARLLVPPCRSQPRTRGTAR